jgi:hypothetical protein
MDFPFDRLGLSPPENWILTDRFNYNMKIELNGRILARRVMGQLISIHPNDATIRYHWYSSTSILHVFLSESEEGRMVFDALLDYIRRYWRGHNLSQHITFIRSG